MAKRDYYEVLGVERSSTLQEIKKAYRSLAVQYHPDRNAGDAEAEERFKEAAEAYQVLSDDTQRQRYDALGHAGLGGGGFGGFNPESFTDFNDILGNIFGDFFGGGFSQRSAHMPRRGDDLRYDMEIEFEEAVRGMETTIRVPRSESCSTCSGRGAASSADIQTCAGCGGRGQVNYAQGLFSISRTCPQCRGQGQSITKPCAACRGQGAVRVERKIQLRVPAGIEDGSRLRLVGKGEAGHRGGPPGDLYVVLRVKEHDFFQRHGSDLHCQVPITFSQAALGTSLSVPSLDGEATLEVPEGTQAGTRFRIRKKGVPRLSSRGRGDLIVQVLVQTPKRLSVAARELFTQLSKEEEKSSSSGGLFERVKEFLH